MCIQFNYISTCFPHCWVGIFNGSSSTNPRAGDGGQEEISILIDDGMILALICLSFAFIYLIRVLLNGRSSANPQGDGLQVNTLVSLTGMFLP